MNGRRDEKDGDDQIDEDREDTVTIKAVNKMIEFCSGGKTIFPPTSEFLMETPPEIKDIYSPCLPGKSPGDMSNSSRWLRIQTLVPS